METQQRLYEHLPTPGKDFRQGSRMTHNLHVNGDSMASPDMSSGIISAVMEDDGSFTYNIVPDHVPKTTKCVQHTMAHDSPAKVLAKLKSQLQRERHPLHDVASTSNLFPNEVLALKRDQDITNVVIGRRRLIKSQGECVSLERLPQSPAKLFDHIKERERNRLIQEGSKAERGKMMIQKKKRGMHAMELKTSMNDVRSVPEGADDRGEDVQPFVVDPILQYVNSPHIHMRRKREDVHKVPTKPTEDTHQQVKVTGVYLTKWMLKSDSKGLYVDGICQDNNLHWRSSSIVTRVSNTVLKTTSGTYNLVGRMAMPMGSELPHCFLKKFADGFPEDWRMLYDKFMSESINFETNGKVVKRRSEKAVTNHSVKRQRRNVSSVTVSSLSCTPMSSAKTGNVSRSGRMIKTPLDYWRGGRVIVDKDMNITIYDSFNTTICLPQVEAEVSRSNCAEKTRSERKPPPRHRNGVGSKPAKQTGGDNEPLNTDLSIPEGFSRRSTSIAGITAMQPTLYTDGVPESEANSNHRSRQRSKSTKRRSTRKGNPPASSDPPTADQASDSNDDSVAPPHSRRKGTKALRETGSKARKNLYKAPPN